MVCCDFYLPNEVIHATINSRGYPLFIEAENSDTIKYAVVRFSWSKTVDITLPSVISPCVLMTLALEGVKYKLKFQRTIIVTVAQK